MSEFRVNTEFINAIKDLTVRLKDQNNGADKKCQKGKITRTQGLSNIRSGSTAYKKATAPANAALPKAQSINFSCLKAG